MTLRDGHLVRVRPLRRRVACQQVLRGRAVQVDPKP